MQICTGLHLTMYLCNLSSMSVTEMHCVLNIGQVYYILQWQCYCVSAYFLVCKTLRPFILCTPLIHALVFVSYSQQIL